MPGLPVGRAPIIGVPTTMIFPTSSRCAWASVNQRSRSNSEIEARMLTTSRPCGEVVSTRDLPQ